MIIDRWEKVGGRLEGWSYKVSSAGGVFSLKSDRLMRGSVANTGYQMVTLRHELKAVNVTVHSLVCQAFIGDRPSGSIINHKNGIKTDNRVENLEYASYSENLEHAWKNRLRQTHQIAELGRLRRKLTRDQVVDSRIRFDTGETIASIARRLGMSEFATTQMVKRLTYKEIVQC